MSDITLSAQPRHIGRAVEGHCRALLRHAIAPSDRLDRALPFPTVTNPDAVILDKNGLVLGMAIVAQWTSAANSDSKYYRTRTEYVDVLRAFRLNPEAFSDSFVPITVLYGTASGWKREILADLRRSCPEVLFLPSLLGSGCSDRLTSRAYAVYANVHAADPAGARDYVERYFADPSNLDDDDRRLLELLQGVWRDTSLRRRVHKQVEQIVATLPAATVPEGPFRTRYRQGLVLASLFASNEIRAWLTEPRSGADLNVDVESFVRRGVFLDVVDAVRVPRIGRVDVRAEPRRPLIEDRGELHYDPGRVDFASWEALGPQLTIHLLDCLKQHTWSNPRVFTSGIQNLAYGNWRDLAALWTSVLPAVCDALRRRDEGTLARHLRIDSYPVSAETFHKVPGFGPLANPVRQAVIAAVATAAGDRRALRQLGVRARVGDDGSATSLAASVLDRDSVTAAELLQELQMFCAGLLTDSYDALAGLRRPVLLTLSHSASWISSVYGNLVTNSTYNPLSAAVREHLEFLHNTSVDGWPAVRSVTLNRLDANLSGRVQWQFAVRGRDGEPDLLAEVKTVTANNWGNKSKEIYGRIAATRDEFTKARLPVGLLGVLDGDIDQGALDELATGVGYDTVVSIDTVVAGIAERRGFTGHQLASDDL